MDFAFGPEPCMAIGHDILDIGSRKAQAKRQRGALGDAMSPAPLELGMPGQFDLPNVEDPARYCRTNFASVCGTGDEHQAVKFAKGTTTLAFKFNDGIIISVDSRSTMGNYISSGTVQKIIKINPFLLGTMAGGAADCSFWERNLGMECRLYELRNGRRITVAAASKLLANVMSSYRGYGLSMGTMVTGWDETGPQLYYVDDDGTRLKGRYFSVGSGSMYAYGVLDTGYKPDLTVDEAIELGTRAIYHATHRDAASGGINNLYHMTKDGWKFIHAVDVNDLHYKYAEEKKNAMAT
ncbi:Proteasome subunit pbs-5 [Seminavis robusta]|uniref:proteasome endopeptidase complex n=2 Tax=Seminavis robusta TaxID=568900 RepID=A0A9N8EJI5_9STRA|nr:Proteasome subunit pbs-5 [Seminavis robusta]|eukprot:Sro1101_g241430.1 Proteasome subunit pbs-5 (295) ;mRNA; f:19754-20873